LTLDYSGKDAGAGLAGTNALMDGNSTLAGHGLASGQPIRLLKELKLGAHTFSVTATDNVNNSATATVTFTVVVTANSIKDDVTQFLQDGSIKNNGLANSLLAKLNAAQKNREKGNCTASANQYQAFINELEAQSGKGIDADAAQIMIGDAQFLIANCP
jgi:hypothetical protein